MTAGTLKDQAQGIGESQAFLGFFLSPSGYMRTISMFFGEMIKERIQARRTVRSGIQPADASRPQVRGHARREQRHPA